MALRTLALYKGKFIGIESIYTVSDGMQLNIPEKVESLREKSRNNELFCPCGCGSNLVLVAGDRGLREQHFRIKDGQKDKDCHYVMESEESIDSKIVLKCWLEDKLQVSDIDSRVPLNTVTGEDRKYEFTFLSRNRHLALSYCRDRENLSDEKLDMLESVKEIQVIYVVDQNYNWQIGQYPEWLIKIQKRQGFCLLLDIDKTDYKKAKMKVCVYVEDRSGLWKELIIGSGFLSEFDITEDGFITYKNLFLKEIADRKKEEFIAAIELKLKQLRKVEENRRQLYRQMQERLEKEKEEETQLRKVQEESRRRHIEQGLQQQEHPVTDELGNRWVKCECCGKIAISKAFSSYGGSCHTNLGLCLECGENPEFVKKYDENRKIRIEQQLLQQEYVVKDEQGNRWIKCEYCGKTATEKEFVTYGGAQHINLGTCKECNQNNAEVERARASKKKAVEDRKKTFKESRNSMICRECGGTLVEKMGKYGKFLGCSNYPKCRFTRK